MKDQSILIEVKEALIQLVETINKLSLDEYTKKIELLSNSTIGEHTRHIIEMFQQLQFGYQNGKVYYERRKRDLEIQQNIDFAVESIANIISTLNKENKNMKLFLTINGEESYVETNYYRELLYNLDHSIHHQAIIKIAFLSFGKNDLHPFFGVAKSTLKFRKECVQ